MSLNDFDTTLSLSQKNLNKYNVGEELKYAKFGKEDLQILLKYIVKIPTFDNVDVTVSIILVLL